LRIVRYFLLSVSFLMFLWGAFIFASTPGMIAKDKEFKASGFLPTIQFVALHKEKFGTLPNKSQFDNWKLQQGWENRALFLEFSGNLESDDCPFGAIPPGSYGITVWRGEWNECYASWLNKYSFDDTKSTNIKAMLVFCLTGILLLIIQQTLPRIVRYLTTQ
jgi:hypothetical protein